MSTGPLRQMMRSCSRREKMSKARSPRAVLSRTIGMSAAWCSARELSSARRAGRRRREESLNIALAVKPLEEDRYFNYFMVLYS